MGVSRILFAVVFLSLTVTAVSAYTVVMRDGRRVEIPNEFTVTNSTLTYDVGSGMQVTIQLNTVDIAATERANGGSPGSLLQRPTAVPVDPQTRRTSAGRTITNKDLEKYRSARVESENQRKELGLPSLEERQQQVALIEDRTLEQVRNMRAQEEAYWRSRAEALRAEAAANEAQFGRSSDQTRFIDSFGAFSGGFPFDGVGFGTGRRFNRFGRFESNPFEGFLATPITPFPTFRSNPRRVFGPRAIRTVPRVVHGGRGSRR
jgi:hypothetical protein